MAQMIPNFTGVILAGGLSSRFGSNKALADWRGKSLILHMLDILKPHFPHCLIVTKRPMDYKALGLDVDIVEDVSSSQHPLVGVLSALQHAKGDYSFICGCDMPFLQDRLVEALCEAASGYEAVVPIWRGRRQPLCGVYSQACLAAIRRIMDKAVGDVPFIPWPYGKWGQGPCGKQFSISHGLEHRNGTSQSHCSKDVWDGNVGAAEISNHVRTRFLSEGEVAQADPQGLSFLDVDTGEDYRKALEMGHVSTY